MNPIMLLAQLIGDGADTEALLRKHGFHDLESIAGCSEARLVELLGVSSTAARRMIRQARELRDSPPPAMADPGPGEESPRLRPGRKRREKEHPLRTAMVDSGPTTGPGEEQEVTHVEARGLRRTAPPVGGKAAAPVSRSQEAGEPKTGQKTVSFWRFG